MNSESSVAFGDTNDGESLCLSRETEVPNGLLLSGQIVPEDVLAVLLSFLDCDSILKCRLVCPLWTQIIDTNVWRHKIHRDTYRDLQPSLVKLKYPWVVYYWICNKRPFGRNFVKNHCGQDGMNHWVITSDGGDHWKVENPPHGADELPQELGCTSCFSTSYHSCSKEQIIDLYSEGCVQMIMDELQPCIEVSEWYAGRFDCGCIYELEVSLLNEKKEIIQSFHSRKKIDQWVGREWCKVFHRFQQYGRGVRYVKFFHGGRDTQFWAGHYGSKMTGACVQVFLGDPPPSNDVSTTANEDYPQSLLRVPPYPYEDEDEFEGYNYLVHQDPAGGGSAQCTIC